MMNTETKKQKSLMKRRVTAIVIAAVAVLLLAIALFFVLDFVKTTTFEDVDGQTYYIRKRDGVYAMYDGDRNMLPTESHGYYRTVAETLVEVNAETGEYEVKAVLDLEGNEVEGFNSRLLLFPHIEKKNILSIQVHNSHGEYTFVRCKVNGDNIVVDPTGDFIIQGSPLTLYDQEKFASLYVGAVYTLSVLKLNDPIKDANGAFTEYGLAPQVRQKAVTDEDGNAVLDEDGNPVTEDYQYEPAWYVLTDTSGNKYKVIVGDPLVTGGGYYVQYVDMSGETEVKRDAVYVLDSDAGSSMTCPIEDYVTPTLTYPMSMNTYFDVEDFVIGKWIEGAEPSNDTVPYEKVISFSYIDLSLRENTINSSNPYEFSLKLDGYTPSSTAVDYVLQTMYDPTYVGVTKLAPSMDDLCEYGIYTKLLNEDGSVKVDADGNPEYAFRAAYTLSFKYDVLDDNNEIVNTLHHTILISDKNEDGNYYAYTLISDVVKNADGTETIANSFPRYNMVVELAGYSMDFLEWDQIEWVSSSYIDKNIAYITNITLQSPGYSANFDLDNSLSDQSEGTNSNNLTVNATDSQGHSISSFGEKQFVDKWGVIWKVTTSDIQVYGSDGSKRKIKDGESYYAYNKLDNQVLCKTNPIECDGMKVEVGADTVRVIYTDAAGNPTGVEESYVRYDTSLFRLFYQTMLYASIVDSYDKTLGDALVNDDSKWLLTMTITTKDTEGNVVTTTYSFYQISSRKAYITINGNGGFYVTRNRVDKFISDAQRFFNYQVIEPTAKT
ncbi:MAG: hypothetical protein IJW44_02060 [Clostridia bacterium]|nr:hypothetical protein [Clostridia bacterium]